jgi:hypothetical protein
LSSNAEGVRLSDAAFLNVLGALDGPCAPPPAQMTAWWPFDETSGTAAGANWSMRTTGRHFNGPIPAPAWSAGALSFDGADDYVAAPDHPALDFPAASSAWTSGFTRTSARNVAPSCAKACRRPSPLLLGSPGYHIFYNLGHFFAFFGDGFGSASRPISRRTSPITPIPGQWTFRRRHGETCRRRWRLSTSTACWRRRRQLGALGNTLETNEPLIIGRLRGDARPAAQLRRAAGRIGVFQRGS